MKYLEYLICLVKIVFYYFIFISIGYLNGIVMLYIFSYLKMFLIKFFFSLEKLNALDMTFVSIYKYQRVNLLAIILFENFDAEKLRKTFIKGINSIPKLRSRLVFRFYNYYWEKVPFDKAYERISILDKIFETEQDFLDYSSNEANYHIDIFKELPYKIQIAYYKNIDGSLRGGLIFKFDHCVTDGLGMVSALCTLADNYDKNNFPQIYFKKQNLVIRLFNEIFDNLLFIVYGPIVFYNSLFGCGDKTPFKEIKGNIDNDTKIYISKMYELEKFSKYRKRFKLSFNDFVISLLSISINKISKSMNYDIKRLMTLIPIGSASIPESLECLKFENTTTAIYTEIPIINDIETEAMNISNKLHSQLKNTALANATKKLVYLINEFLPINVIHTLGDLFMRNVDINCSNIPGPTKELIFNGCRASSIFALTSTGRLKFFVPIVSYNNKFRIVMSVNNAINFDGKKCLSYYEEILDQIAIKNHLN